MIDVIRKLFEANPEQSTLTIDGNCSDCGNKLNIKIKSTSGGFGIQGGILIKRPPETFFIRCIDCEKFNS